VITTLSCSTGEVIDLEARQATITVAAGEQVTCTFTNRAPRISVMLDAVPNTPQDFSFEGCQVGSSDACGPFLLDDDGTSSGLPRLRIWPGLALGTYEVTMAAVPGWTVSDISCTPAETADLVARSVTITLTAGEDVDCTFRVVPTT
jgi:hypothetical protein